MKTIVDFVKDNGGKCGLVYLLTEHGYSDVYQMLRDAEQEGLVTVEDEVVYLEEEDRREFLKHMRRYNPDCNELKREEYLALIVEYAKKVVMHPRGSQSYDPCDEMNLKHYLAMHDALITGRP